jgi:F-type H+-transporting ATPase subunit delta
LCWSGGYATLDKCSLDANYRNALQSIYKSQDIVQVNIPAESGDMGVLANHVPSIEQLKPGLIEVIEESGSAKQFFGALI